MKHGWLSALAFLRDSRSADLALHDGDGNYRHARAASSIAMAGGCTGFPTAWSWLIMKPIFSPVKVTGLDKIDTSKPHVYAVNHASALDIPVLYVNLPFQFRIAFKKELLAYPDSRLAVEALGPDLHRPAESVALDQQHSRGA